MPNNLVQKSGNPTVVLQHGTTLNAKRLNGIEYIRLTDIAEDAGHRLDHYLASQKTQEFLQILSSIPEFRGTELLFTEKRSGENSGTWAIEEIAHNYAQYVSPVYAVAVAQLLKKLRSGDAILLKTPEQMTAVALHQLTGMMLEQANKIAELQVAVDYEKKQAWNVERIQALDLKKYGRVTKEQEELARRLGLVESFLYPEEDEQRLPAVVFIKENFPVMRPQVRNPHKETHDKKAETDLATAYSTWVKKNNLLEHVGLQEDKRRFGAFPVHHYPVWFLKMTFPVFQEKRTSVLS